MSQHIHPAIIIGVRETAEQLTDGEVVALYQVATEGFDPRYLKCYGKAGSLFTECNGMKMHGDVLAALGVIVEERLRNDNHNT